MKNLKFLFTALLVSMGMMAVMTACSDSDDDTPELSAAKTIAGKYTSDLTCTVMGTVEVYENVSFVVTAVDDNTVNIAVPECNGAHSTLPALEFKGLKVTGSNGVYTIASTEFSGVSSADREYKGTVKCSYSGKTITIDYTLFYGAMPMSMDFSFTGSK